MKSSLVLKEDYLRELEGEIERRRNDISKQEKLYENEKEIMVEKITILERKNGEL